MQLKITNPEKILFQKPKITKLDVINYYIKVANKMMLFVENRPLSVIRCPHGSLGECFFKKHPGPSEDVQRFLDGEEEYFFLKSIKQLIAQVQMGTLEFHTWASTLPQDLPNQMVFDLDPDQALPHQALCDAVLKIKSLLDELGLVSFLKTSGGKGFHVVVPFWQAKSWQVFYDFAKNVALIAEARWPSVFTTNIKKSSRKGKIFVDYLRNNRGSTCAAAYSLRCREGAPISMPILWKDIEKIKPNQVTLQNFEKYENNAWQNFFKIKQKIK